MKIWNKKIAHPRGLQGKIHVGVVGTGKIVRVIEGDQERLYLTGNSPKGGSRYCQQAFVDGDGFTFGDHVYVSNHTDCEIIAD